MRVFLELEVSEVRKAVEWIKARKGFASFVPEVGSNVVFARENALRPEDVAGVDGRIRRGKNGSVVVGGVVLGASSHGARIVLQASEFDSKKRCAMNLAYSQDLVERTRVVGLSAVEVDRQREPSGKEGETMSWLVREAVKANKGVLPDCFFHKGDFGKEAMFWLTADNPKDLVEKLRRTLFQGSNAENEV